MSLIRYKKGKPEIIKDEAFIDLINGVLPAKEKLISELFKDFDSTIKSIDSKVSKQALGNSHGDWYEWLLAISAWNFYVNNPDANLAMLLPNVNQFDVANLYVQELTDLIDDFKSKLLSTSDVNLVTSNPDFVIIKRDVAQKILVNAKPIIGLNVNTITFLNSIYSKFKSSCNFFQILGYISVKTSLRPDRRLQMAHEGSLMKAIYVHLQTRNWIINPPGLKYIGVATIMNNADRNALRTVATHSITTVSNLPLAAVDDAYEVNSMQIADQVFQQILT